LLLNYFFGNSIHSCRNCIVPAYFAQHRSFKWNFILTLFFLYLNNIFVFFQASSF
jgi:hypothetical protein